MKAFIISISVILVLIILSYSFSVWICRVVDELTNLTKALPTPKSAADEETLKDIESIRNLFDSNRIFFRLFINEQLYASADLALCRLESFENGDDPNDFLFAKSSFISALQDIRNVESTNYLSIF